MKLLSFIREKTEVHRVWIGGSLEEQGRNMRGISRASRFLWRRKKKILSLQAKGFLPLTLDFRLLIMAKYLDPNATLTFRKVLYEQKDLLQSFLNAVLPLKEGTKIESLEYISPEMVPENPAKKYSMVDVRCTDNHNRQFIVGMQMYWTAVFLQNEFFNTSKAYLRPLEKRMDMTNCVRCIVSASLMILPSLI